MAAERVLFIDVLPQRGRQGVRPKARENWRMERKREKARSKDRSELTGQVNHLILSGHTRAHEHLTLGLT